jgi:molybdenum cofactor cytidylyltransferase
MRSVAAIILAAGGAKRFGAPKQLLEFRGETLIARAMRGAQEAGCAPLLVIVGTAESEIAAALPTMAAELVLNDQWQRGVGTSIRRGIEQLEAEHSPIEAAVLLACDQPFVSADVIRALIAEWERSGKPIVASRYADTLGIPALFERSCFPALASLPDQSGAKPLIESNVKGVASVPFENGAVDIDSPADFERLQSRTPNES